MEFSISFMVVLSLIIYDGASADSPKTASWFADRASSDDAASSSSSYSSSSSSDPVSPYIKGGSSTTRCYVDGLGNYVYCQPKLLCAYIRRYEIKNWGKQEIRTGIGCAVEDEDTKPVRM